MSAISRLGAAGQTVVSHRMAERAPQLATWSLAVALGIQAAVIAGHILGGGSSHPSGKKVAAVPVSLPPLDLAGLSAGHLFGAPPITPSGNDANAPATRMQLVLTGILAATDPKRGLAIIGTTASNARLYPVGERVPGNAQVHAIYAERVVLERNGTLEALMLPRKLGSGAAPVTASARPSSDGAQPIVAREHGPISDVLRAQVVMHDGKLQGYRIHPTRNEQVFTALGLHNGDLVVSINGTPLNDVAQSNQVFSNLGGAEQAHVTVMRDGHQQDLSLNMAQIPARAVPLDSDAAD